MKGVDFTTVYSWPIGLLYVCWNNRLNCKGCFKNGCRPRAITVDKIPLLPRQLHSGNVYWKLFGTMYVLLLTL